MKLNDKKIINEYENYLLKLKLDTTKIYMNIKIIEDIKLYKHHAKVELENLENLSLEYKLYDSNYEEFRIAMGKFAMGLNKSYKLHINAKDKKKLSDIFINFNTRFEELERKNIMKDAYVWM